MRIALTGGIGSGKSLVAGLLAEHGAAIVDTDAIAHRLTAAGGEAIAAIVDRVGADFIDRRGALDRARMRARVFADAAAKTTLERILHPMIGAAAEREAMAAQAAPYLVFAVPLLVESADWRGRFDRVLLVDCPVVLQIERVLRTRALARAQVESIVARQASRADRLAAADDVIVNAGALTSIAARVARLHRRYMQLAAQSL